MIIVVPSCLKDADGARTRSDQKSCLKDTNGTHTRSDQKSVSIVIPSCLKGNDGGFTIHMHGPKFSCNDSQIRLDYLSIDQP